MSSKQGSDEHGQVIADTRSGPIDAMSKRNKSVPGESVRVPKSRKQNRQMDASDSRDRNKSSKKSVYNSSFNSTFRNFFEGKIGDREHLSNMKSI